MLIQRPARSGRREARSGQPARDGRGVAVSIHADIAARAGAGFQVVMADPPWSFQSNSAEKPGRNARRHYDVMNLTEIEALPVKAMVANDAALFLWMLPSFLAAGLHLPIMKAWGFKPSSVALTWVKTQRNHPWHFKVGESDLHFGQGLTTRKQTEVCLLGVRGRSLRVDGGAARGHHRRGARAQPQAR